MQAVKGAWARASANKEALIWNVWRFTLLWVGCFVISAIALAASNDAGGPGTSRSDGFAAIWTMLLIVGLSIGGTMVLRKVRALPWPKAARLPRSAPAPRPRPSASSSSFSAHLCPPPTHTHTAHPHAQHRKPLAVGFFLGVCVMMSVNMFTLFVIFVGLATLSKEVGHDASADNAAAAFAFFLWISYGVFSFLLAKFKGDLIKSTSMASADGVAGEQSDSAVSV